MNTTNLKSRWLLHLLSAAIMTIGLTACSGSDDKVDEPLKPDTKITDSDWQNIPVDGGTIEKGDITIQFPSGTFSSDTKVAVSEVKKGQICGNEEVSKFYQITLPFTTAKSFTVKIKCDEKGDDINAVVHSPAMAVGPNKQIYSDHTVESSYSNGEYTINIPASDNKDTDVTENASISIGLAHMLRIPGESAGTRAVDENTWHYDISVFFQQKYLANWTKADYPGVIRSALQHLQSLGFKFPGKRNIPITWAKEDKEDISGHLVQDAWCDIWNGIALNELYITDFDNYNARFPVKRTCIHELTHVFQSNYDPRWPVVKRATDGDETTLYECAAVWSEKFNDGGTPSLDFICNYLPRFTRSLTEVVEVHKSDSELKKEGKKPYGNHGYGMSALIEYITTQRKSEGFNDKSVVELYEMMKNSSAKGGFALSMTTFDFLKAWAKKHNSKIFEGDGYDDFILKLVSGKVFTGMNPSRAVNGSNNQLKADGEVSHSGTCYPYGGYICRTQLLASGEKDQFRAKGSLTNKRLVIDQKQDGVQTYVVVQYQGGLTQIDGKATKGKPIIINGKALESYRKNENYNVNFYVISTNSKNESSLPSEVTVSLEENEGEGKPADWDGVLWDVKSFELYMSIPVHLKSAKKWSKGDVEKKDYDTSTTTRTDKDFDKKYTTAECKSTPLGKYGIHVEISWKVFIVDELEETGKLTFDVEDSRTKGDISNLEYTTDQWSKDKDNNVRKFHRHLALTGLTYTKKYWEGTIKNGKNDATTPNFKLTAYEWSRDEQYGMGGYWVEEEKLRSINSEDRVEIQLTLKY